MKNIAFCCLGFAFLLASLASPVRADTFQLVDVGVLPGPFPQTAIKVLSGDGKVVLGSTTDGRPIRWTMAEGISELNDNGCFCFKPLAISYDGAVAAGRAGNDSYRLLEGGVLQEIPLNNLIDISADGSKIVGNGSGLWTAEGGLLDFRSPDIAPATGSFSPSRISNDGSTVAGTSTGLFPGSTTYTASTLWTETGGYMILDNLPGPRAGHNDYVRTGGISGDGTTVVGYYSNPEFGSEAYRWTNGVFQPLGQLQEGDPYTTTAFGVSGDGSVVVGVGTVDGTGSSSGSRLTVPWIWDETNGMRKMSEFLEEGGVDLTDEDFRGQIPLISDNGRTLAFTNLPWVVILPSPEFVWIGALDWGAEASWDLQQVPGTGDTAVFRGANYLYDVPLTENHSVEGIRLEGTGRAVLNGLGSGLELRADLLTMGAELLDDVTLQLTNLTLEVNHASLGAAEGAVAKLEVLDGGDLMGETVRVGAEERAELVVDSGGSANVSNLLIARNDGNDSQTIVRNGGVLSINTSIRVGDNRPGKLFVQSGGKLESILGPTVFVHQGSSVEVDGAGTVWSTSGSELDIAGGSFAVKNQAAAEFLSAAVTAGDTDEAVLQVSGQGALTLGDSLIIAAVETGIATVAISDNAVLQVNGITLGSTRPGTEERASLLVFNDATAEISGDVIVDAFNGDGSYSLVNVSLGGSVVQTGALTRVNDNGNLHVITDGTWTNTFGDLAVDGGAVRVRFDSEMTFDKIRLSGGDPDLGIDAGRVIIEQATVTANDLIVVGDGTPGRFALINGVLNAGTEIQNTEHGRIAGTGTVNARVVGPGSISPGLSPGTLTINGDLELEAGGALEIEFAGLTPDTEHDVLVVTGDMTIEGQVVLKFIDGFAPSQGEAFEFLVTTGNADLTAAQFDVRNLLPGFEFDIAPSATGIMMTALSDGVFAYPGDINLDGTVDRTDAALFAQHFGTPTDSTWSTGDFDDDGATTVADLAMLQTHLGQSIVASQSTAAVPEPSSAALLLCGLAASAVSFAKSTRRRANHAG